MRRGGRKDKGESQMVVRLVQMQRGLQWHRFALLASFEGALVHELQPLVQLAQLVVAVRIDLDLVKYFSREPG